MADPSESIHQLKIDHNAPADAGRSWTWLIAVAGVAVIAGGAWLLFGGIGGAVVIETDIARKPPSVTAASNVLDASGYVVARRQTTVSSKVTGKVLEVFVEEGMRVEEGQVVATLDDATQQAQLAVARAQVDSAKAALAETEARLPFSFRRWSSPCCLHSSAASLGV